MLGLRIERLSQVGCPVADYLGMDFRPQTGPEKRQDTDGKKDPGIRRRHRHASLRRLRL